MKLDYYFSYITGMQQPCTALETSFLQYSLDQEIAKWVNIISLIIDNLLKALWPTIKAPTASGHQCHC